MSLQAGMENWKKSCIVADRLMQKGWAPYVPHHSIHMWDYIKQTQHRDIPWDQWMKLDEAFLRVSKALYFMGHSKGADRELKWATDRALPVYTSIDQVPIIQNSDLLDER